MNGQEAARALTEGLQTTDPHTAVADLDENDLAEALTWLTTEAARRDLTDDEFAALVYAENSLDQ